jgi:hypothetical protein
MRVKRIEAANAKGFENFAVECGDVNIFTGRNGCGKTSVADILCAGFSCEGDRNLLREGAAEGHILIVLEDEEQTWEVRRTLRPGEVSQPRVKGSKSGARGAPAKWLKEIADLVGMDVLRRAMTATPKEQGEILLQTMVLELAPGAIEGVLGGGGLTLPLAMQAKVRSLGALDAIQAVYDHLYEERTGVNRLAQDKEQAVRELSGNLGSDNAEDLAGEIQQLEAEQKKVLAGMSAAVGATDDLAKGLRAACQKDYDKRISNSITGFDETIRMLQEEKAEAIAKLTEARVQDLQEIDRRREETARETTANLEAERLQIVEQLSAAQERQKAHAQQEATRAFVKKAETERDENRGRSKSLTGALDGLKGLRASLLEKLPIKGLEFRSGRAYLDGVALEEVNTQKAAKFWIRVAVLRAQDRDLGAVVLDNAEHFDTGNFDLLVQQAKASGTQFFITRVTDGDFKIEVL